MRKRNERCITEQRQGQARPFLILSFAFLISHFSFLICNAQTFTQRIQQQNGESAKVTIHQSADIDKLVNSAQLGNGPVAQGHPSQATTQTGTSQKSPQSATQQKTNATSQPNTDTTPDGESVDLNKKVMRGTKMNGYRVQAFAGGNSRKDRQQAEQTGNTIKSHFPNVPVYVHFYSPRWICRVGNFRTYEEAHQMLVSLRNLGYTQASIVKGKITVAN